MNDEIKNNETGYYTNIHFIDHFCVNIDSKQSVVKEYPSNVAYLKFTMCDQCMTNSNFIIVAFLENATIGYSLESLCVCVCVCVFLHEFDIELHRIKVKVTVGVQKFSPFTTIQTVRSYSSTLVQARNLILSIYLHLILIYKIYVCRHA